MFKKIRNNIGVIILITILGLVLLGATYVNLGPTSLIDGDIGVTAGHGYYIGDTLLSITDITVPDESIPEAKLDIDNSPADEYVLTWEADSGKMHWQEETGGGASTFVALTDTPANYTDQAGKYVKVNAGETALEFGTPVGGGTVTTSGTPVQYDFARFTDATTIEGREYSEVKTDLAYQLSDMSDVGVTTPTDKYVLVADGDSWESRALVETDISDLGNYLTNITGESLGDLSDVDMTDIANLKILKYNSTSGNWECEDETGGGGTFTGLTDTPANYTGSSLKHVRVNVGETALEFVTLGGGGDMLKATYDTDDDGDIDVAAGGTEKSSWTLYAIPYLSGTTAFGEIPIGTAEYCLTVNATATGYDYTELAFLANIVEDTTPQLGGQLQSGAHSINFTEQVLTSGTTIAWNLGNSNKATLTAAHNFTITITAPSGALNAQLIVTQDGTGTRVMDEIVTQSDAAIAEAEVHIDTEIIDLTIDIPTGARIRFKSSTTVPAPLVADTIYWAIRTSENHIQVATTKALAIAGTAVNLTDDGTGTHTVQQLVKWSGGTLGVLTTDAGAEDILALTYKTADKQWYAVLNNDFY